MDQNENIEISNEGSETPKTKSVSSTNGSFFEKNKKALLLGGGGLLLVLACLIGYKYLIVEPDQEKANIEAFKAEDAMDLDDSLSLALNGDSKQNIAGLKQIADDYGYTKAGKRAALRVGVIYLKMGKFDDAIEYLEKYDLNDNVGQTHALGNLGQAYAEKKDFEKAASYYQKAADHAKLLNISSRYQKLAGLAYEQLKQYDKAYDCYNRVLKEYYSSEEARDIDKYIERANTLNKEKK